MAVLYYETEHYNIRYYRDGSDTSSDVVEKHAAETTDNALHGIQAELTEHKNVTDGSVHGIDALVGTVQTNLTSHQDITDGSVHGISGLIGSAISTAISGDIAIAISTAIDVAFGAVIYSASISIAEIGVGVSDELPLWAAPDACTLQKVSIIPGSTITGVDTDYFTLGIIDKGSSGTGTDSIVSMVFDSGENAAAFATKNLGVLDVTHKVLAQGDVISFKKSESGSGMAMPDLVCVIEYKLN